MGAFSHLTRRKFLKSAAAGAGALAANKMLPEKLAAGGHNKILPPNGRFKDIEWTYFNTTGIPDSTVPVSKTRTDFKEYKYFVGQNSAGLGTELPEFNSVAIKVIFQTTNSSLPPMIKDFRAIAFQA